MYGGFKVKPDKNSPPNYSPVNFDNYDAAEQIKYPEFASAVVHKVRVQNGDCLFLPANWWHRVTSSPLETLAVSHWYEPHDSSVTIIWDYINEFQ